MSLIYRPGLSNFETATNLNHVEILSYTSPPGPDPKAEPRFRDGGLIGLPRTGSDRYKIQTLPIVSADNTNEMGIILQE